MARNKDYWARRAKRTQDELQNRIYEEYVAAVEKAYTDAIHRAEEKIRVWYQRLADNNGISYAEAQKLLAKNELEEFHWSVEQYIKHGMDNLDGQWSKQLENASARVHISRYDALKFELQALAKEATGKTIGEVKDAAALAYTESYNHTAFDLQQQVGVGVTMQGADSRKLEHVLNRPWSDDGKTFSARCWEGCDNLVSKVNRELFRMVATGEAPDRAIEAIAKAFGTSKANAGRVVMTESAAIASQAQHDCYTELGVEEFEVIGTFDSHMCDFCGEMNGQHFPESKRKVGENAPPFHPWCRCTTAPYDEDLAGIGERWMRDPETGKGGYVPADMTYQEWKEIYVDKTSTMEEWEAKHVDNSGESGIIKLESDILHQNSLADDFFDLPEEYLLDLEPLSLSNSEFDALRELNQLAIETGNEHAIPFVNNERLEILTDNLTDKVSVPKEILQKDNVSLFHCHTNNTPLSIDDLSFLTYAGVKRVSSASLSGNVFSVIIGNGERIDLTSFQEIANSISDEVTLDLMDYPGWENWTLSQRNYMAIYEQMYRIVRKFGWTLEGGRI